MEEAWKDVPGYEGLYQVSSLGRVKSTGRIKKILKPWSLNGRYLSVSLSYPRQKKKHYLVHRLVAMAFYGKEENLVACHNDGNPFNNKAENVRWDTSYGNMQDQVKQGKTTHKEKDRAFIMTPDKISEYGSIRPRFCATA